jgi:uncharacterized 2Fe-2S/4Fe-4S cluster protein (DUF4445 family)
LTHTVTVSFVPAQGDGEPRHVKVPYGTTVLQAASDAGIEIAATCGRRGRCRSCRVKAIAGTIAPPAVQDTVQLGHEAVRERFRLSCQMPAIADCTIMAAPPSSESGHKILAGASDVDIASAMLDCGVEKRVMRAKAPEDEHNQSSDLEEVLRQLPAGIARDVPIEVLRQLPKALRAEDGLLTVTTFAGRVIHVEPGDTAAHAYGMAFDVGTTSVVGALMNLKTGETLASVSAVNAQAVFGGDLMSRIAYAQFNDAKLQTLRGRVLNQLNEFIEKACNDAGVSAGHIYKIVIVGNTCMHHICLGIDTSYVGLAPYAPTVRHPIVVPAGDLPLKRAPNAQVCFMPIVAGFVGADTIAGVIATRIYESKGVRLLIDIGTNGEVVMGSRDKLLACSAPAGPTFEGGQVKHGMRGAAGAIERVTIGEDVACQVIGEVPAIGICGSGLIDAAAQMLAAGVLEGGGRLRKAGFDQLPEKIRDRFVTNGDGRAFSLVAAAESGKNEDIVLTQNDVRQLQLAKAAIYGGVMMLQKIMEVPDEEIEEVLLSGGFGNYVNIDSAIRIRLLPNLPRERITYVGNAALLGAQLALLSETERHRAEGIARQIEHVSLATRIEFQDIFVDACSLVAPGR